MQNRLAANCIVILAFGLLSLCFLATFWPHEPTDATRSSSHTNVQLVTVPIHSLTSSMGPPYDAVFALDCISGRLQCAVINGRTAKFTKFYFRDVAADFGIDTAKGEPQYVLDTGNTRLRSKGRIAWDTSIIYVGELRSGKINAYAFPFEDVAGKQPPIQLQLIDTFPFRQPMQM